jgi:hypothetical protein
MPIRLALMAILSLPVPALAQQFTTAAEVRPILEATRANWVALRRWDGKELLYFTHLEAWRCGMVQVRYAVNGGAELPWDMPPCLTGTPSPNAIPADRLPFTDLPAEALQTVTVVVVLADGTELRQDYARAAILMP